MRDRAAFLMYLFISLFTKRNSFYAKWNILKNSYKCGLFFNYYWYCKYRQKIKRHWNGGIELLEFACLSVEITRSGKTITSTDNENWFQFTTFKKNLLGDFNNFFFSPITPQHSIFELNWIEKLRTLELLSLNVFTILSIMTLAFAQMLKRRNIISWQ